MENFTDEIYEKFKKFYKEIYRGIKENDINIISSKNGSCTKKLEHIYKAILLKNKNIFYDLFTVEKCTEAAVNYVKNIECITDKIEIGKFKQYVEIDGMKLGSENFNEIFTYLTDQWKNKFLKYKKLIEKNNKRKKILKEHILKKIPQMSYLKLLDEYDKLLLQYLQKNQKTIKQRLYLVDDMVKAIYEEREDFIKSFNINREEKEIDLFESSTDFQIF